MATAQATRGRTNSSKPLNEFALRQTERLSRAFSHITWDDVAIREYKRIVSGLAELYGTGPAEKAVTATIDAGGFLDPAKLRTSVPTPERKYCPRCRDAEGWLSILVDGEKMPRRIKCRHQPLTPTMRVKVGEHQVLHKPGEECHCDTRKERTAMCCDYVDAQVQPR
jgi:hypothetical protein